MVVPPELRPRIVHNVFEILKREIERHCTIYAGDELMVERIRRLDNFTVAAYLAQTPYDEAVVDAVTVLVALLRNEGYWFERYRRTGEETCVAIGYQNAHDRRYRITSEFVLVSLSALTDKWKTVYNNRRDYDCDNGL